MVDYNNYNEVTDTSRPRPHVVILGAGASRAACPDGDVDGRILPLMNDFMSVTGLGDELRKRGISNPSEDLEVFYSQLQSTENKELMQFIEDYVYDYFESMGLQGLPTMYDHLVLSLREKDLIATFNWDPLLFYALARNRKYAPLPQVAFLHGNVAMGYCIECYQMAHRQSKCPKCNMELERSRLVFPTPNKDYSRETDQFIEAQWNRVRNYLTNAYMLTIFGYSAPTSDTEATSLLLSAWETSKAKPLAETEIVNPIVEDLRYKTFSKFIFESHWRSTGGFYNSWISKHPRRTCEALWAETMEMVIFNEFHFPQDSDWSELYDYLAPRIEHENLSKK